jgi:teichuronic acid exporter
MKQAKSLKQKSVSGIIWNFSERIGNILARLFLGVLIARLLNPEDYGLVGMIMIFIAIANSFVDSGFSLAYVQKKEVDDIDANTVFYTNLTTSVLLYSILWLSAPLIAQFYEQPELILLTRIMSFSIIINSFKLIQVAKLIRNVNFKQKSIIKNISVFLSGFLGVIAAYNNLGVWSLVIQSISNRLISTLGFWIVSDWKPGLQVSKSSFKNMFSFGGWILASGIIVAFFNNLYIMVIGKVFNASLLGFYTKAKQFQQLASEQLSNAVGAVAFPIYSKYQEDKVKLKNAMQLFLSHTMFLIVPILVVLIVVADSFVLVLLTEKWAEMIPFLRLLCLVGLFYPIHVVNVQALVAQGKSKLNFKLEIVKNFLRVINIIISYRFGIIYIILGEVILSFIAMGINSYFTKKMISYGLIDQIKHIGVTVIIGLFSTVFGYFLSIIIAHHFYNLLLTPLSILAFYLFLQRLLNTKQFFEILELKNLFLKKKLR